MRSLEDGKLVGWCNTIFSGIKSLWRTYYANTNYPIDNYEIAEIVVPKHKNNHDSGFHMLLHARHWDGRSVCYFKEKDIGNIKKIWARRWLSFEENDADWENILNLK